MGDFIDNSDQENFIGRTNELSIFRDNLLSSQPLSLIFFVFGQGGVGKSELLKQYKNLAEENGHIVAVSDETQTDIPLLLDKFSRDVEESGGKLKRFSEKFKKYQQLKHEVESDPNAPLGLASFIGQSVARVGLSLAKEVPVLRQGVDLIDKDALTTQTGEWVKYLAQKWAHNREDLDLIKNPILVLSKAFFADLNEVSEDRKVILCFENYEATRDFLDNYLTKLREYHLSLDIRLVIACRTEPGQLWKKLGQAVSYIPLDVFSPEEAEKYLDLLNIKNKKRRKEIIEFSGRLPILMSWLSSPSTVKPDPTFASVDIVELFLKWVNEPRYRKVALDAAIPHFFNLDTLKALLRDEEVLDVEKDFEWLIKQPFVTKRERGWQYHPVIRRIMLRYQKDRSKDLHSVLHSYMMMYYQSRIDNLKLEEEKQWRNKNWIEYSIEYIYHAIMENPVANWHKFINFLVDGLRYRFVISKRIAEVLLQSDIVESLDQDQVETLNFIVTQLRLIDSGERWDGIELYERFSNIEYLSPKSKSYILFLKGEANRVKRDYPSAIKCLDDAIDLDPSFYEAITEKGSILSFQKEHELAIAEFDRALAISPYHWAYERKGAALYGLHEYEKALITLDDAKRTNDACSETFALRGACFLKLGQYEDALDELNKALEINSDHHWAKIRRGELYLEFDKYELALLDFESVMKVSEDYTHESLKNIGLVYSSQGNYKEAAEKFFLSLENSPACGHCWTSLIDSYVKVYGRDALTDLMSDTNFPNIEFSIPVRLCRAAAYSTHGYIEAISELNIAIGMDENLKTNIPSWVDINGLGLKLGMEGRFDDALKCFEFEAHSDSLAYKYNKAVALALWKGIDLAEKEIKAAEEAIQIAIQSEGYEKGLGLYGMAGLEAVKNNKIKAISLLREAISIAPGVIVFARNTDPAWLSLKLDPEFQEIVKLN